MKLKIIVEDSYLKAYDENNVLVAYQPKNNTKELDLPLLPPFKKEIVGYRLKPNIDRLMVDSILKNAMPIWNDEDKSVYFIRGHVGGSLVNRLKELQVLNLWFTPIYENEEVKSDWVKKHHLEYYYEEGLMSDEMVVEDDIEKVLKDEIDYWYKETGSLTSETFIRRNFSMALKAATKVYTENDLRKSYEYGNNYHKGTLADAQKYTFESLLQSLKPLKTPTYFLLEKIENNKCIGTYLYE